MRADNNGEGGILALMAVAQRGTQGARMRALLGLLGIGGACLFFGDGVITPAISVLSAVEGLEVVYPEFSHVRRADLGRRDRRRCSPSRRAAPADRPHVRPGHGGLVQVIAALGVVQVVAATRRCWPRCRRIYALQLCIAHGWLAFVTLGAVVLTVTGAEALYADMGHFGAHADPAGLALVRAALRCC